MTKLLGYVEITAYFLGAVQVMKLTSKGRYAVTAMLDVAIHSATGPVPLADISERQGISLSYLEQLFAKLRKHGLPGGGYRLGLEAVDISVGMVVHAVDESVDATRCQGKGNCQSGTRCLTHSLWGDLSKQISDFLDGISLAGLMQKRDVRFISLKQDEIQKEHRVSL